MRLARLTSSEALSSGTRPIERRYRRSESRLGSTVRSSSRAAGAISARAGHLFAVGEVRTGGAQVLGGDQLDPVLLEVRVELDGLLAAGVGLLERGAQDLARDLAVLERLGDQA